MNPTLPRIFISSKLEAADKPINVCGYHRRDQELADAKRAILHNT